MRQEAVQVLSARTPSLPDLLFRDVVIARGTRFDVKLGGVKPRERDAYGPTPVQGAVGSEGFPLSQGSKCLCCYFRPNSLYIPTRFQSVRT